MLIKRILTEQIENSLKERKKVIILYGPRQAGKTTLINLITQKRETLIPQFIGDDLYTQRLFEKPELESLKKIIGDADIFIIDEAQRIENIGLSLKLLIDNLPITILASGSASFELANKINEPLTGRTKTFLLYPLSYQELKDKYQRFSPEAATEEMLRFGMYPEVHTLSTDKEKEEYLYEYMNKYLYKDILMFDNIKKPKKIIDLLTLLALQIGSEVSIAELAQNLVLSQNTVINYLDVLEKMFILVNLRGFSRNLRKEISKTSKYYFVDVGLHNSIIRNFNPLSLRSDTGALFENWFIMEKIKLANNSRRLANFYFWRTYDQQEIDLIEEREGKLIGYECKWNDKKVKTPQEWLETYGNAEFQIINQENYSQRLLDDINN